MSPAATMPACRSVLTWCDKYAKASGGDDSGSAGQEQVAEIRDKLIRIRRQAAVMQAAVQGVEYEVMTANPRLDWSQVLLKYKTIVKQFETLRNECDPLLQYFVMVPNALPMNPVDIPMLLSTKELPAMEAERRRLELSTPEWPNDPAAETRHNSMIDELDALFEASAAPEEEDDLLMDDIR